MAEMEAEQHRFPLNKADLATVTAESLVCQRTGTNSEPLIVHCFLGGREEESANHGIVG